MRAIVVAASSAILVLGTASASAGGGVSSFEFDDGYAVVGESITDRATFYTDTRGTGRIEDGPWYAYLMPEGQWIEAPRIPEEAIPLGQIAMEDRGSTALASITFTVPDVPLGGYHIGVCNLPCTESMVGDLYGGFIWIARTAEGAELLGEVHRTERALSRYLSRSRSRFDRRVRDVERPLTGLEGRVVALGGEVELRLSRIEGRLRAIQTADESQGMPWTTVVFTAAAVVTAGAFLFRARRRRPEPVPEEPPMVEWEVPEEVSART